MVLWVSAPIAGEHASRTLLRGLGKPQIDDQSRLESEVAHRHAAPLSQLRTGHRENEPGELFILCLANAPASPLWARLPNVDFVYVVEVHRQRQRRHR